MGADLTPVYLVTGTAASVVAVLAGARSYARGQRKRWTDEGVQHQRNAEALEKNTEANRANTSAIEKLANKLEAFATETRRELTAHDGRIGFTERRLGHLEDLVEGNMRQAPRRDNL